MGIAGVAYVPFAAVPALIVSKRRRRNITLIYLLNSFLGWTIVAWIAAVIWAIKGGSGSTRSK